MFGDHGPTHKELTRRWGTSGESPRSPNTKGENQLELWGKNCYVSLLLGVGIGKRQRF